MFSETVVTSAISALNGTHKSMLIISYYWCVVIVSILEGYPSPRLSQICTWFVVQCETRVLIKGTPSL